MFVYLHSQFLVVGGGEDVRGVFFFFFAFVFLFLLFVVAFVLFCFLFVCFFFMIYVACYTYINKLWEKTKGTIKNDHLETLATLVLQETEQRQTKTTHQKQQRKLKG